MLISIIRDTHNAKETFGKLCIDGFEFCDTIEDPWQNEKIPGETRIPAGTYRLQLNKGGGMNQRYKERFPTFHEGMIEICDIPDFTHVYIHIGNTAKDSAGCPLVGFDRTVNSVLNSTLAYAAFYNRVINAVRAGEAWLMIQDHKPISGGENET